MGTHPIFESDFDCLTEWSSQITKHSGQNLSLNEVLTSKTTKETSTLSRKRKCPLRSCTRPVPHLLDAFLRVESSWEPILVPRPETLLPRSDALRFIELQIIFIAAGQVLQQIAIK